MCPPSPSQKLVEMSRVRLSYATSEADNCVLVAVWSASDVGAWADGRAQRAWLGTGRGASVMRDHFAGAREGDGGDHKEGPGPGGRGGLG